MIKVIPVTQIRKTVLFNTDTDQDLLDWLAEFPNFSEAVRQALRQAKQQTERGDSGDGITLQDIYQELQDIKRNGFVSRDNRSDYNEPADIAANLDLLGL
jgi:hypothetical protein